MKRGAAMTALCTREMLYRVVLLSGSRRRVAQLGVSKTIVHTGLSTLLQAFQEQYPHRAVDTAVGISSALILTDACGTGPYEEREHGPRCCVRGTTLALCFPEPLYQTGDPDWSADA